LSFILYGKYFKRLKIWVVLFSIIVFVRNENRPKFSEITTVRWGQLYLKAVFPSRNLGLMRISRSRFKQSKNCSFISRIYVLRSFANFWGYLEGDSFSQWISEIKRIRNGEDLM